MMGDRNTLVTGRPGSGKNWKLARGRILQNASWRALIPGRSLP